MTAYLVDTNVLARLANGRDPLNPIATRAVTELHRRGEVLYLTPSVRLMQFFGGGITGKTRPFSACRGFPAQA